MDDILRMASDLGKAIARHERYGKLRQAEDAAAKDAATSSLLERYEKMRRELGEAEAAGKPVEPAQKHAFQDLTDQVHGNELLQNLARTQADYMELMNRVNAKIRKELDADARD